MISSTFGLFTRKPTAEDAPESTRSARPGSSEVHLLTPTLSMISLPASAGGVEGDGDSSPASYIPATPSPPLPAADAKQLYDLMLTIPAKTLHAYTRASLTHPSNTTSPPAESCAVDSLTAVPPPSPETVSKLQRFFVTLPLPPLLHCNKEKDNACRVPHDDESALVSRVPGVEYETL
ncbi:hypothetical protein SCLCIDRAFT_16687 [Scleroderma citrinum Foug A]|uniref:Uncharacterized protein n=1 Tax=Scleroderma citrinum Foug A TaxID=1036808 RepID=A0A0C3DRG1_9AGAM|nr:hypothetical protein SCLCIDRAFT_16687 [Scleroderma citrinum Foug A]